LTTEIQQNRYDQLLRRVSGIIGPGSKVSEVLSELFPMIDVEDVPAELLILMGTRTASGGTSVAAEAAVAPKFQLFNPDDSNVIITISRIIFSANTTVVARWGRSTAIFAATRLGNEEFNDTRNPVANRPVGELRVLAVAGLANGANQMRTLASDPIQIRNENSVAVLSPGFGYEVGSTTVNVGAAATFYWRERVAEQSELNL